MKIRTQIVICTAAFVAALLVIAAAIIITTTGIDHIVTQENLAQSIEIEANELGYLSSDYSLYRERQQVERWESKFQSLSSDVSALEARTPEQEVLITYLKADQRRLRNVFDDVSAGSTPDSPVGTAPGLEVIQVSWSRLAVQTQAMAFDAGQLLRVYRNEENAVREIGTALTLLLAGLVASFILVSYLVINRRVLREITALREGMEVIGDGDLSRVIPEQGDDEIADLARSFNRMAQNLKTVVASRSELLREVSERKRAEDALHESESILRAFFDSPGILRGIVEVTPDHDLRHIADNREAAAFAGLTPETMRGRICSEVWEQPDILALWIGHYLESMEGGGPVVFEYPDTRGGSKTWLNVTVSYLGTPDGGNPRFAYVALNTTRRREIEEDLVQNEVRLALAQEAAGAGFWDWDVRTDMIVWSPQLYRLFGIDPAATPATFETWNSVLHPDDQEEANVRIGQALERKTRLDSEYRIIRPGGEVLWINALGQGVYDDEGKPVRMYGICVDITGRKRTEELLKENTERLNLSLEVSQMGTWDLDLVRHTAHRSLRHDQIFGYADLLPEWTYEMFLNHVIEEDRGGVDRSFQDALEQRKDWNFACRIRRTDGIICWIMARGRGMYDEDGRPVRMIGIVQDITDRKEAEETLRETSQELENLIAYANAPIIVWGPDFRITRFNHAFERLTGRNAGQVIGQPLRILFPNEYAGPAMEIIRKASGGERMVVVEIPILNVNGETRTVLWNSATLYEPDGVTIHATIAQGNDITDRKRAEAELSQRNEELTALNEELTATQEDLQRNIEDSIRSDLELRNTSQYLENLVNYANAPIVVWDPDFRITRFNRAFEDLTGRTAREIIGEKLEVLFPPRYLDSSMEVIRRTMEGERLNVIEIPIQQRSGEIRIVLWNSATLYNDDGKTVRSTIAQGNDITDRKMAEARLEEKNRELGNVISELTQREQELSEALREREVLLSEIHHRVKNNLTAFISLLSLKGSYDDTPAGQALKKDLQNRARSMALIHETLYRTGKYSQVDMRAYLTPLVQQIGQSYDPTSRIQREVDTGDVTLDLNRATPCGLIITELITNSYKYAFPDSFDCGQVRSEPCTIRVSLTREREDLVLVVSDNGIGLPPGLDISGARTLGLRLVTFLARHQLKATIAVEGGAGTRIAFRFQDRV